ncbi:MAG: hypothetical protein ACM3O3_13140 [Syntrophothermus sp.]
MNNDIFNNPIMYIFIPLYAVLYVVVHIGISIVEMVTGNEYIMSKSTIE